MRFVPALLLSMFALVTTIPAAAAEPQPQTYARLAAMEARVAAIGFRLTTANARWCPRLAPQIGWILGDPWLYSAENWPLARTAYAARQPDRVYVAALAPGGPAASGGTTVGSSPETLNGAAPSPQDSSDFGRIAAWEKALARLPPAAPVTIGFAGGGSMTVTPSPGCASSFRVEARDKAAAAADGELVLVSAGLVQYASDDAQLAAAIAHELSHNILAHRARLDAAGIQRGILQQWGRNAQLTKVTEVEADRLSVWLMAGAGYDPEAAVQFWTRFGKKFGGGLFQAGTHPRWRDRVASIKAEIMAMRAARRADPDAPPPLIGAPPPLE